MEKTLLIITGASRGLGRAIGIAFASSSSITCKHLGCLLVARSESGLEETASLMREAAAARTDRNSTNKFKADISCMVADLSDMDTMEQTVKDMLERLMQQGNSTCTSSMSSYNRAILINNAGSLGYLGKCSKMASLNDLKRAIDFNVTSSSWITSQFVRKFSSAENKSLCVVVNISSLCAMEPFSTMSVYCAGKAARDLFHSVLAKEESAGGVANVRVLNYAPGMCETAMSEELAESDRLDSELSTVYRTALSGKTMVRPKDTAEKLVGIIERNEWRNGDHVDFWDR
jgi:sepiapterin reductase